MSRSNEMFMSMRESMMNDAAYELAAYHQMQLECDYAMADEEIINSIF